MKLHPRDVLVLLLFAPGRSREECEPVAGLTRLQKMLFLLGEESPVPRYAEGFYRFRPYRYGPFSSAIYDDLEFLEAADVVRESKALEEAGDPEYAEEMVAVEEASVGGEPEAPAVPVPSSYELTDKGRKIAQGLWGEAPEPVRAAVADVKTRFNLAPLSSVIAYVYSRYPAMAAESELLR